MVTLRQIADRTGFHVSVVSRALNKNPDKRVAPKTRLLIEKTARELGYRPNRAAEFLRRGSAPTIGVFLPRIANRLMADLVFGMAECAEEEGFPLSFSFGMTPDCYARFVEKTSGSSYCGIITYPYDDDMRYSQDQRIQTVLDRFQSEGGKVVLVYSLKEIPGITTVSVDDYEGGRLVAERLLAKSCQSLFLVEPHFKRAEGFLDAMHAAKKDVRVLSADHSSMEELASVFRTVTPDKLPIGVFAACGDKHAVKVMAVVKETQLRLGSDVLLIGYNDHRLSAELSPSLTSIHQPFEELGRLAVKKIINLVYDREEESQQIKPYLVERESG